MPQLIANRLYHLGSKSQISAKSQDNRQGFDSATSGPSWNYCKSCTMCVRAVKLKRMQETDLEGLNVIHIAGTKGKGSTCGFLAAILNERRRSLGRPSKIGLFTSPHMVSVRERIQINAQPISEISFTEYFFHVWRALPLGTLGYFRFLTLLSFFIFREEGVDAAIYETGVGGEDDATNVIQSPVATGITSLGIDYARTLRVPDS